MALRVLSGFVNVGDNPGPKSGQVRIRFNPHERIDGDAPLNERKTVGAAGRFIAAPAKHVALRQITLLGATGGGPLAAPMPDYEFRLGDTITRDDLTITWGGSGPAFSEEIAYMVIGEVPDAIPNVVRRGSVVPKKPRRKPKSPRGRRR